MSFDRIEYILNEVKKGRISERRAVSRLETMYKLDMENEDGHNKRVAARMEQIQAIYSCPPEEIVLEKERVQIIAETFRQIMQEISPRYQELMELYVLQGLPLARCADMMGLDRRTVDIMLKRIAKKVQKRYDKDPKKSTLLWGDFYESLFQPKRTVYHTPSSKPAGFPFEHALRVESAGWYTTKTYGNRKRIYSTKTTCKLNEYWALTFGEENDVVCPKLCGREKCIHTTKIP